MKKVEVYIVLSIALIAFMLMYVNEKMNQSKEVIETVKEIQITESTVECEHVETTIIEVHKEESKEEVIKAWDDIPLTFEEQTALWDKCQELEINYWFVIALLESESNYRADAHGDSGKSVGYMQINKCNWERMKNQYGLDVHNPTENLLCGATIFWELSKKYDTITQVVMSYKCGETGAKNLLEQGVILSCVETITNRAIELENSHRCLTE